MHSKRTRLREIGRKKLRRRKLVPLRDLGTDSAVFIWTGYIRPTATKNKTKRLRTRCLRGPRVMGQIWRDAKLFGAPVAEVLEQRDQVVARGAERIGDFGRRAAHRRSVDNTVLFQFA